MVSLTMEISAKCGCNYPATKRISKTATINSISKTQRATRFDVWSYKRLIVVFLMTQLLAIGQVDAMTLRPRHLRKRHSSNDINGNWENPCGGTFLSSPEDGRWKERRNPALTNLDTALRLKYGELNSARGEGIDISDISMWSAHNGTYKFIPKLRVKKNSTIALRRWYTNFQVFVAAFSYLNSTQEKLDQRRQQRSPISDELHKMLHSARALLCEIESAINHTTPYRSDRRLTRITRKDMEERLHFRTKKHLSDDVYEVDYLDLKFMKYYLLEYLHNMSIIIARRDKNGHRKVDLNSKSESTSSVSDNSSVSASKSFTSNEVYPPRKRLNGGKKRKNQRKNNKNHPRRNRQRQAKNNSLSRSRD